MLHGWLADDWQSRQQGHHGGEAKVQRPSIARTAIEPESSASRSSPCIQPDCKTPMALAVTVQRQLGILPRWRCVTDETPAHEVAAVRPAIVPPAVTMPDGTTVRQDEWAKTDAFLREQRLLLHRGSSH